MARARPHAQALTRARHARVAAAALAGVIAAPTPAAAQGRVRPELRLEGAAGAPAAVLGGIGLVTEAGTYTRLALLAGGGGVRRGGTWRPGGEAAVVGRFLLDPLRQSRVGVSVGGGVAARVADGATPRWLLVAHVGLEGRPRGRLVPAVELGVGGGARLAVVLRRPTPGRR